MSRVIFAALAVISLIELCGGSHRVSRVGQKIHAAFTNRKNHGYLIPSSQVYTVRETYLDPNGNGRNAGNYPSGVYAYDPRGHTSPSQGYISPPQGYISPPQGYISPPQGYISPPQGYISPPQGYISPPQGYISPPQGYAYPLQGSGFVPRVGRETRLWHRVLYKWLRELANISNNFTTLISALANTLSQAMQNQHIKSIFDVFNPGTVPVIFSSLRKFIMGIFSLTFSVITGSFQLFSAYFIAGKIPAFIVRGVPGILPLIMSSIQVFLTNLGNRMSGQTGHGLYSSFLRSIGPLVLPFLNMIRQFFW